MKKLILISLFICSFVLSGCMENGAQKENVKREENKQQEKVSNVNKNQVEEVSGKNEKLSQQDEKEGGNQTNIKKEDNRIEQTKQEIKKEELENQKEKEIFQLTKVKNGKYDYTITGKTTKFLEKIQVVWKYDGKKDEPYVLSSYNSGNKSFNYNIKPKFKNIEYGSNKYLFIGKGRNGKKYVKSVNIEIDSSKKELNKYYSKGLSYVYFDGEKIEGSSPDTFEKLGCYEYGRTVECYAKDKKNVYYNGKKIKGADSKTFEKLSYHFAKDKNNVYYNGEKIKGKKALIKASRYGYKKVVKFLIENGINIGLKNKNGKTALDIAKEEGNDEIVEILKNNAK